jgi:hypothetical protein
MTEIVIKKNYKKKKPKRDKLKRWSVVFVEDSDNETDKKIIHIETELLQQTSRLDSVFPGF